MDSGNARNVVADTGRQDEQVEVPSARVVRLGKRTPVDEVPDQVVPVALGDWIGRVLQDDHGAAQRAGANAVLIECRHVRPGEEVLHARMTCCGAGIGAGCVQALPQKRS
jgi:hypothetical protein